MFLILRRSNQGDTDGSSGLINQIVGSVALVGGLSTLVYLAVFLPYYWFGWWRGIRDQFSYFQTVYQHQQSLAQWNMSMGRDGGVGRYCFDRCFTMNSRTIRASVIRSSGGEA